MGEVDEALRHAFAQRTASSQRAGVPPGPHRPLPGHNKPGRAAGSRFDLIETQANPTPLAWVEPFDPGNHHELVWPEIVQVLEREWGQRFEQTDDSVIMQLETGDAALPDQRWRSQCGKLASIDGAGEQLGLFGQATRIGGG